MPPVVFASLPPPVPPLSSAALKLRERLDGTLQLYLDELGIVAGGAERVGDAGTPALRDVMRHDATGAQLVCAEQAPQDLPAETAAAEEPMPPDPPAAVAAPNVPAPLLELKHNWCDLEQAVEPAHAAMAGVRRVLDRACSALQDEHCGVDIPANAVAPGANALPEHVAKLVYFCESELVRRPKMLRGASIRIYDMQAQLRLALAGLRGKEMSAAEYREMKKIITMLGINLSVLDQSSPAGLMASQESTMTVASPSGRTRRPPSSLVSDEFDEPKLPASVSEYVQLLPSVLGASCAPLAMRKLIEEFPGTVGTVRAAVDADTVHGLHEQELISRVRYSDTTSTTEVTSALGGAGGLTTALAVGAGSSPADASVPLAIRSASRSIVGAHTFAACSGGAESSQLSAAAPSTAFPQPTVRQAASEPWRTAAMAASVAVATSEAGVSKSNGRGRKASKSAVRRYHGDGRRSSPRTTKTTARATPGRRTSEQGREQRRDSRAKVKGQSDEAKRASGRKRAHARTDISVNASSSVANTSSMSGSKSQVEAGGRTAKRPRNAKTAPLPEATPNFTDKSSHGVPNKIGPLVARPSAPLAEARVSSCSRVASASARSRTASVAAPTRAQAPASPLPLLPSTVLAHATPQQPTATRNVTSSSPLDRRLELSGIAPPPLARESPGGSASRHSARVAVLRETLDQAAGHGDVDVAGLGAARGRTARRGSDAKPNVATLLQLMD